MKNKSKKKIYKDKKGRDFIKVTYFIGGKMKCYKVHVIDGIPADEFYKKNATDLDFFMNGDFELINSRKESDHCNEQSEQESDLTDDEEDLPF